MNLNDSYMPQDGLGPRGFVILSNPKTGQIYVKKHNLVLNEGRKILMAKLLNGFDDEDESSEKTNNYSSYNFVSIGLSDNAEEPSYGDVYNSSDIKKELSFRNNNGELSVNKTFKYRDDDPNKSPYILFSITAPIDLELWDTSNFHTINSLGIIMSDGTNKKLFSRITFDPIPITNELTEFKLDYYIYF